MRSNTKKKRRYGFHDYYLRIMRRPVATSMTKIPETVPNGSSGITELGDTVIFILSTASSVV